MTISCKTRYNMRKLVGPLGLSTFFTIIMGLAIANWDFVGNSFRDNFAIHLAAIGLFSIFGGATVALFLGIFFNPYGEL